MCRLRCYGRLGTPLRDSFINTVIKMVKLTEDMVVARSKGSDLYNVRKLNCWGSELSDVSVVRKLQNVEVLSLSVNRICTLADFQYCPNLQELYIRKNIISDINEILYLRQLPKLKSLCSMGESVRSESGGGSSLSDCSPPSSERRFSQTTTPTRSNHQDVYGQSLDDDYEYSQAVYEDDEQPVITRRSGYNNHYVATDPERRISQMSQHSNQGSSPQQHHYGGGRRTATSQLRHHQECNSSSSAVDNSQYTRRFLPTNSQLPKSDVNEQASSGYHSGSSNNSNTTNGLYYRADPSSAADSHHAAERLRRDSYASSTTQSPSRRSSQVVTEADPSADTRGYIRSPESSSCTHNVDYEYDSRNANYLSRDDTAPRYTNGTNSSSPLTPPDNNDSNATNNNPLCPLHNKTAVPPSHVASIYVQSEKVIATTPPREVKACPLLQSKHCWVVLELLWLGEPEERERAYSRGDGYGYASSPYEVQQSPGSNEHRTPSQDPRYAQQFNSSRNANLLSAVLCLIKELDYTSLEVVEMAARCRMEELDD
ncbi:Cilia- and flagella-associated protein 410-like [Homarus americanus]|uniref:Cilia- and flagella-associated protein 410-like n=1 Tax=Homarus americanus TaxID=6706 RepID=A0A8J5JYU4_HOMAM|nr:Cilia- and flagella-associated protein 410-like [Homarus americanus]